jgi:signal peptidase I
VRKWLLIAIGVMGAVAVTFFVFAAIFMRPYRIPSAAMEPTVKIGDRVLVPRLGGYDAERGDIVVFHPPSGSDTVRCGVEPPPNQACAQPTEGESDVTFVKRIVAVGGDRLSIERGGVVLNGERQDEPYARLDDACQACNLPREITVPDGHVYMLGDNRAASADSREWGPVPEDSIVGRVVARYWPPSQWGTP